MSLSIRTKLIVLLLISLMLAGCGQKSQNPVHSTPTPSSKITELPVPPNPPSIEHPAQLIFRSDSAGLVEVNKGGEELYILRGPHSDGFNVKLSENVVYIKGKGQGKIVFVAKNGSLLYFSRMWVAGLDSPSFAILPENDDVIFIKPGDVAEIPLRVVPIGNFSQQVELNAVSTTKNIIPYLSASGVPPFNATMKIKASGMVGDGGYIKITGRSANKTVESYIRVNNPVKQKEGGLLSSIFKILWAVLLPVRITIGIALGTISGVAMSAVSVAMLSNPVTFLSPHMLDAIALGPSSGVAVTEKFLKTYPSVSPFSGMSLRDGNMVGISTVAVGSKFKVLLPYVEIRPIVGKKTEIPIYVAGSGTVELNISAPSAIDAKVVPERGVAPFKATVYLLAKKEAQKTGIIFKKIRPYTVTINATSDGYYEIYRLYLKPLRKDYEVKLSSDVVYLEPGTFASVKAVVLRNNNFSSQEHALRVVTPDGIKAFVRPKTGRTPYVANVTFYTENADMGKYVVDVGGTKMYVIVGRSGYALVAPKEVQTLQGSASNFEVEIYSLGDLPSELKANIPLKHTITKLGDYTYKIKVSPGRYTPPGIYRGSIQCGIHKVPISILVGGTPVVVEYNNVARVSKGEAADVTLSLKYAGYSGDIALNFTASDGVEVIPDRVTAHVPGEIKIQIKNVGGVYGTVSFSGVAMYNGTPYSISGSISVIPSGGS